MSDELERRVARIEAKVDELIDRGDHARKLVMIGVAFFLGVPFLGFVLNLIQAGGG